MNPEKKIMTILRLLFPLPLVWVVLSPGALAIATGQTRVYVTDFRSETLSDRKSLLRSFTEQFERALIASGAYIVLDRRKVDSILRESHNEVTLGSLQDLPSTTRSRIKQLENADGVIFGEVVDDSESGEVVITATLETFDSVKRWKHAIAMKKGLVQDYSERQQAMYKLVSESEQDSPRAIVPTGDSQRSQIAGATRQTTANSSMLSDPDPNVRLSYMEEVVKSGKARNIQSALRVAFGSADQSLRSLGVRTYIASQRELNFDLQLQPEIQSQFDDAQGDPQKLMQLTAKFPYIEFLLKHGFRLHVAFGSYEISDSRGVVSDSSLGTSSGGTFTISGDRVTGNVRANVLRPGAARTIFYSDANNTTVDCGFDFRPTGAPPEEPSWKGTLSCQNWGNVTIPRIALSAPIF
jgi:hypothetical protein